jgi:hypothetical protein
MLYKEQISSILTQFPGDFVESPDSKHLNTINNFSNAVLHDEVHVIHQGVFTV